MVTDKTLLEKMQITEIEIQRRMALLGLSSEDLDLLASHKKIIENELEAIVEEFYGQQTQIDEVDLLIGDSETLRRLRVAQRQYIIELFDGYYDAEYVNSRLRIGLVHKRIGVDPKLFLAGIATLKSILFDKLEVAIEDRDVYKKSIDALDRLLYFDVTLVFDTYIDTLLNEVESAKRRMETYAGELEEKTRMLGSHAERDALTGLFNNRGMLRIIRNELRLAKRRHTLLSVIYIDVDRFKLINDTYGHPRGDEMLVTLSSAISDNIRGADFACRVGGDEFCVILPDCDEVSATSIARRISETASARNPELSISVGVSETGKQEYVSEEDLIRDADERMYDHKVQTASGNSAKDSAEIADRPQKMADTISGKKVG